MTRYCRIDYFTEGKEDRAIAPAVPERKVRAPQDRIPCVKQGVPGNRGTESVTETRPPRIRSNPGAE